MYNNSRTIFLIKFPSSLNANFTHFKFLFVNINFFFSFDVSSANNRTLNLLYKTYSAMKWCKLVYWNVFLIHVFIHSFFLPCSFFRIITLFFSGVEAQAHTYICGCRGGRNYILLKNYLP